MKKLFIILTLSYALVSNAQNYTFSKVTGSSYFSLSGATIIKNGNWSAFEIPLKMPFTFKYWGVNVGDSIYLDNYGAISMDDYYNEEISFLWDELASRWNTSINYKVEGTTPNRILKIEYKNMGFELDRPALSDSASVQCWFYETSNIIEFRYGTSRVKSSSWEDGGPYVGIYLNTSKFINLEGDPLNPTVNKTNPLADPLTGIPLNGTIYKFTPTTSGIKEPGTKIKVISNMISLPASVDVKSIRIYNNSGQIVQSVDNVEETDLSSLIHGIYFIVIQTSEGVISEKKFL